VAHSLQVTVTSLRLWKTDYRGKNHEINCSTEAQVQWNKWIEVHGDCLEKQTGHSRYIVFLYAYEARNFWNDSVCSDCFYVSADPADGTGRGSIGREVGGVA